MTELVGHWSNTAELSDDRSGAHFCVVPLLRTTVKLEGVRHIAQYATAMDAYADTVGMKLRALKERADLSLARIAEAMGRPKSSVQRLFEPEYRPGGVLDLEEAIEVARALVGKGEPPIKSDDVLALTALPKVNDALGTPVPEIAEPVAEVMARAYAAVLLQGQEPRPEGVEALAHMIRELSLLHQADPAMRGDPARSEGALQLLTLQLSRIASSRR